MGDSSDEDLSDCAAGGNICTDLVEKCNTDGRGSGTRTNRNPSGVCATRKCVLTLDGYSYVIGELNHSQYNILFLYYFSVEAYSEGECHLFIEKINKMKY